MIEAARERVKIELTDESSEHLAAVRSGQRATASNLALQFAGAHARWTQMRLRRRLHAPRANIRICQ